MDQRARFTDFDELLETVRDTVLNGLHIAIPVAVDEDSADGHTVKLKALIKTVRKHPDGREELLDFPPFTDVPIQFHSGGGVTTTFPIKKALEGIYLISSRGFDAWHQQGGAQPAIDARRNSLSDGFFIPGVRSNPNKLKNVSTTSAQTRSDDGKHVFDLHPQNGPSLAADEGKHTFALNPKTGATLKTTMALAVDAADGMSFKGAAHFADAVTSAKSFDAPGGSVGGGFQGAKGGFIGALIGAGLVYAMLANQAPPTARQQASFTQALVALPSLDSER